MAFQPSSLDAPLSGQPDTALLADLLGEEDPQLEHVLGMQAVAAHWDELPPREQKVLLMRFYDGMTQVQISQRLGVSQTQVSRLLGHALGYLRPRLLGLDERAPRADGVPDARQGRAPGMTAAQALAGTAEAVLPAARFAS
jgi:RNA polymerase sigma-B factor